MTDDFFIGCTRENHWQLNEIHRNDEKIISLNDEYKKYWRKIVDGENFALVRYADGERALMTGKKIIGRDFWQAEQGLTLLGRDLKNSLGVVDKNFVYGISCPCCDSAAYYWYLRHLENCNVTFSNIWVNANFAQFWEDFHKLERDAVLITNYRGQGKIYGRINVKKHYLVGDDCVNFWAYERQALIQKIISEVAREKNLLFAVSAGPISELIIKALYENNPDNCYIDFGSALDLITHGQSRAGYTQSNSPTSKLNCWMFAPDKISIDVDVVLSAYKRPQVLAQQFEAVKNQTLKPRRIFLYQDAVKAGENKIVLDEKILSQLDGYEIANENGGVWKRFEYAAKKTLSPYVCIFDDDTIPGNRWLENCHMHAAQVDGVYGANCMVVRDIDRSKGKNFPIGWRNPNEKTFEVDYVGHSWFIRREYLNWMLELPYKNRYKYSGEDMALSYACLKHGIKTFVPAHPKNILALWGSIPKYGFQYGTDKNAALSENPENLAAMQTAAFEIHNDGWRFLFERDPEYFDELIKSFVDSSRRINDLITNNVKIILKFFGKKPPAFIGDEKYSQAVKNLFALMDADYNPLSNKNNVLNLRPYALNIFFTDEYPQLKNFLEKLRLTENEHFIDGRIFLMLS